MMELTPLVPGPYVDSTCSEGQVVARRPNGSVGEGQVYAQHM